MPVSTITAVQARELLDSRGRPTVEVEVHCRDTVGRAIVPSGASTGRWEACELRDGVPSRFEGLGVTRAIANVREQIAPALAGRDAAAQSEIDRTLLDLDGTRDKSRLGANAVLGVSLAVAHAAAAARRVLLVRHLHDLWRDSHARGSSSAPGMSLPLPMVNMISGGKHAGGRLDFQDYLLIPHGAESYPQALEWTVAVYGRLGAALRDAGYDGVLVGDEGGYGPRLPGNEAALELLLSAIEAAGLVPGRDASIGLDVAATHFHRSGAYHLQAEGNRALSSDEMIDLLAGWVRKYPLLSIEDGLAEDDWDGWTSLTARLGERVQILGDDLFTTSVERIRRGIDCAAGNCVLIKPNQIGTLSETFDALRTAMDAGYRTVVSARSGETEDATIADIAVATGAGQIKIGSVARSERLAKYNQLSRLTEWLGSEAPFAGAAPFARLSPRQL